MDSSLGDVALQELRKRIAAMPSDTYAGKCREYAILLRMQSNNLTDEKRSHSDKLVAFVEGLPALESNGLLIGFSPAKQEFQVAA